MNIEIDEKKILSGIFELDGKIHKNIREEVERILIDEIVSDIKDTYFKNSWQGILDEIKDSVLEDIKEQQEQVVKKILKDFYNGYRYGKKDIAILKKLKELLGEN
jgi:hypothetical protein